MQHFAYASDLGCRLCNATRLMAGHQQVNIAAQLLGSGDHIEGCRFQYGIVVFCNDEYSHLDHLRFVFKFSHELFHVSHFDAAFAGRRFIDT
jgi:hypothetical protein